jgi:hypothetical protein
MRRWILALTFVSAACGGASVSMTDASSSDSINETTIEAATVDSSEAMVVDHLDVATDANDARSTADTNGDSLCQRGQIACQGRCVDPSADTTNCGSCGVVCQPNYSCSNGACVPPAPPTCDGGLTYCNGQCVDTNTDRTNCGRCGAGCPFARQCVNGTCACSLMCNGLCVDDQADTSLNCGACGNDCVAPEVCINHACGCLPGLITCGSSICTDPSVDIMNCGGCGNDCGGWQNATSPFESCNSGQCAPARGSCATGFDDCDGLPANGCETDINTNVHHCGGCGRECYLGTCVSGVCTCPAGQTACSGHGGLGCSDLQTDVDNCGTCGHVCGVPCANGVCQI